MIRGVIIIPHEPEDIIQIATLNPDAVSEVMLFPLGTRFESGGRIWRYDKKISAPPSLNDAL